MRRFAYALLGLSLLSLTGCLEREETVTVKADGSIAVRHVIHGDKEDLEGGAAAQPAEGTWRVVRSARVKKDGKVEHVLTATAAFARASDMPSRFDESPGALVVDTDLKVTPTPDGKVYRFARVYQPRMWAPYAFAYKRAFPDEVQKMFKEVGEFASMPQGKRERLVRALRDYERGKALQWAEASLTEVAPQAEGLPEARLAVLEAVSAQLDGTITTAFVERLLAQQEQVERESESLQTKVDAAAVRAATRELNLTPQQALALQAGIDRRRQSFDVSEDLGDESFVVRVVLPGKVLRHNADSVDGNTLVWRFGGQDLRDRTHRLIATSIAKTE